MNGRGYRNLKIISGIAFLFVCIHSSVFAQEVSIPDRPQGYVNDFAQLIQASDKISITNFARELQQKTTAQVAIVTIKTTAPGTIEGFSIRVFDKWKIGQAGKDNGILILVAVDDRKAWITTGYGLEGALPDIICSKIVRDVMIPAFKSGQYSKGIMEGAVMAISLAAREYGVEITGREAQVYQAVHRKKSWLEIIFTILFFILILGSRSGLLGYFLFGSLLGGRRRGGYWHGSGFGGSSGGFGGGFGGFGGGMSGGGGGGGGW